MKRNFTFCLLLFALFCLNSLNAQTTTIEDPQFEQYLIDNSIDSDGIINKKVLTSDISGVSELLIYNYNISDFEGLQNFTSLTNFQHQNNQSTTINNIDFSGNSQLLKIDIITAPNLAEIDISQNLQLTHLQILTQGALFNSIDVSKNGNLVNLIIVDNAITNLITENNTKLAYLNVNSNPITELKVSHLSLLQVLVTFGTSIEELDLSKNNNLVSLTAQNGALNRINIKNNSNALLTYLDLRNNLNLTCILVDDASYAETATDWYKDAAATYIDETINFTTPAEDKNIAYDSTGNYHLEIDSWLADNGGAEATSNCGEIIWSHGDINNFVNEFPAGKYSIIYEVSFFATDIFGIRKETFATLTVENANHFSEEQYGSGSTICDDKFDLNTIIVDINPKASLKTLDISNVSFERVEGPPGPSFDDTTVDFPDIGAGSYSYIFNVSIQKSLKVYEPANGNFDVQIIDDEAIITISDKTVAFETEEIADIIICPTTISSIQDLTDLLTIFPNLPPQNPIDLNQYWTPAVYTGSGTYTFDPTNAFPACPSNAVSITVTEVADLSAGTNTNLQITIGSTVTEAQLLEVLQGEDVGGTWSPLPLAGAGTYTYTHGLPTCPGQSAEVVVTESTLSVFENELLEDLLLYPNPTNNMLYLKGDTSMLRSVEIFSTKGQQVMAVTKNLDAINLNNLKSALYFVKMHTENATKVSKIIKK